MKVFRDRVAVVTGGASGIGRAVAERLAAEGMKLVIADVERGTLHKAESELRQGGADCVGAVCDVSKPEQVDALAAMTLDRFGAVHVVFNNAGVYVPGSLAESPLEDLHWVVDVNLWGVINGVRTFVPIMEAQATEGHVVNTASMAGLTSAPYLSIYCITKHAVVTLSECLYKELQMTGSKLGVSVVCPGLIKTQITDAGRNRPGASERDPPKADATPGAALMDQTLRAGIEGGYPPSVVADQVLEGIRDDRFYVIPSQPEVKQGMIQRIDELRDGRNPGANQFQLADLES